MGVKDTVTTKYMRQIEIFADIFNFYIYDGKQVIDPASLEELDTRELGVPYGGEKGARQPVQKNRDIMKSVIGMADQRTAYLLLAIENQSNIHYAMPVKNMVYDALQYAEQVESAAASHRKSGDYRNVAGDEYLSGFLKRDRLLPVVTLVVYFDSKEWDGPLSIHEMFQDQDKKILALVPDYKINLVSPAAIRDDDFDKFHTSLKEVLSFIKYARNKAALKKVLEDNEAFRHLGREEVDVLNACVGANIAPQKGEEETDVCLAIEQMIEEAAQEAAQEATQKAAQKARNEQIAVLAQSVRNLMEHLNLTVEQAMDAMGMSEQDRQDVLPLIS